MALSSFEQHLLRNIFFMHLLLFDTGARSESRDLESQIIIVTDNFELRKQLYREQRQLFDYGSLFTRTVFSEPERKVSFWINGLAWLLKNFF